VLEGVNGNCSEKCTDQDTRACRNGTWKDEQQRTSRLRGMEGDELQVALVGHAEPQVDAAFDKDEQTEREVKYSG